MDAILTHVRNVRIEHGIRPTKDRRFIVSRSTDEYIDETGEVYRKSFEWKPPILPRIPVRGTHKFLNSLQKQY
jgi:hypothetical protein